MKPFSPFALIASAFLLLSIFSSCQPQYNKEYQENVFTYANNIHTIEGGTHLIGFRTALTRTLNNYAQKNDLLKNFKEGIQGDDTREGLTAVISVKIPEPQFEGQTKTKLGNSEVKGFVEAIVGEQLGLFLEENPLIAKTIVGKLLEAARAHKRRFHHVSTDEVYGSLAPEESAWNEHSPYAPRSPYSASKAASDHLVRAYHTTYGLETTISNCSNNYGPYHYPEKMIPLFITNLLEGKKVPIYGDGLQVPSTHRIALPRPRYGIAQ